MDLNHQRDSPTLGLHVEAEFQKQVEEGTAAIHSEQGDTGEKDRVALLHVPHDGPLPRGQLHLLQPRPGGFELTGWGWCECVAPIAALLPPFAGRRKAKKSRWRSPPPTKKLRESFFFFKGLHEN